MSLILNALTIDATVSPAAGAIYQLLKKPIRREFIGKTRAELILIEYEKDPKT